MEGEQNSEGNSQAGSGQSTQAASSTQTQTVDAEALRQQILSDLEEKQAAAGKTYSEDEVKKLVSAETTAFKKQMLKAFGDDDDEKVDPITRRILTDGSGFVQDLVAEVMRESQAIHDERENERGRQIAAWAKLKEERLDIIGDKKNMEIFKDLLESVPNEGDVDKRMQKALTKFDNIMEAATGKTSKERVDEATQLASGSSSGQGAAHQEEQPKTEEETWSEELKSRNARHKAIRNASL